MSLLIGLALLALALVGFVGHRIHSERWDPAAQQQTIRDAGPLIAAIHAYHDRNAAYPRRLGQLTPEFIVSVPNPTVGGRRWTYWVASNGKYQLVVEPAFSNAGPLTVLRHLYRFDSRSLAYDPGTGSWHFDY